MFSTPLSLTSKTSVWIRLFTFLSCLSLLVRPLNAKTLPESIAIDDVQENEVDRNSNSDSVDLNRSIAENRILNSSKGKCKTEENEALIDLMNGVCTLCHDFYSHQQPNMRVKCSKNCFRNRTFHKCLKMFSPPKPDPPSTRY